MDKFLELLSELLPASIAFLAIAFGYLVFLFKKVSGEFIAASKQQAEYLRDRVDVVDKSTQVFTRTIEQQEKEIAELRKRLKKLTTHVEEARSTQTQLAAAEFESLSTAIEKLAELQQASLKDLTIISKPAVRALIEQLDHELSTRIPRLIVTRDLSLYKVELSNQPGADELIARLEDKGYEASIYGEGNVIGSPEEYEAIWLGNSIPPDVACQVIATAHEVWPHLKYVEVSGSHFDEPPDYVNSQIFLGGATSTAIEYGIKEWSDTDFRGLQAEMSLEQIHNYVRARYKT